MESNEDLDPATALGIVGAARQDLADRLVTPWWYHFALGLSLALVVASWATGSAWVVLAAFALYGVTVAVLPRAYGRATGIWVNGTTPPRARRFAYGLGATAGLGIGLGASVGDELPALVLAAAVACFALTVAIGRRFDATLRAELREDPSLAQV